MKKILLLTLIFLTACGAPTSAAAPASSFDLPPAAAALSSDLSSEQIQRAMLESAWRWTTIQMEGAITWYAPGGSAPAQSFHEQTWIDPLNHRFRSKLTGDPNSPDYILKLSDGTNVYNINYAAGKTETAPYPDFARVGQYVPPLEAGKSYPNPIWGQLGTPLSELAFSANYAQNQGSFKPLGMESIAGREALIAEWTYVNNSQPSFKIWLDKDTAVILKLQEFAKEGGSVIQSERVVNQIVYNQPFDASLFALPADAPQPVAPTQVGSAPVVTGSSDDVKTAGELYFFLQPRGTGGSIQLARVSGVCVFDQTKCPPLEIIKAPFPFNFTLNALSWSPDGSKAAFAYPDNAHGTPQKLFVYDPAANAWTSLAQFPYIDPPFWSPDGTWIAFRVQDGAGGEDVYVVHRDGSELKSVAANLPADGRPYIMDGWYTENIIMRSALPGSNGSIYLVRASDGFARPMFDALLTKAQFIAAPDASLLAYDEYDYNGQGHILKVMEPDGANPVTLANFTGGSIYPIVWSPDSKLIAFNYYSSFNMSEPKAEVYIVSRDGSALSLAHKGMTVGRLVFSPNGKYLLVEETTSATGGHLFLVNLATMQESILQAPGLSTDFDWYAPSWRP